MKDKKRILIKWYDAKFCYGPYKEREIGELKMSLFNSIGYLISKNKTTLFVATEYSDDGEYRDITLIPKGSVVSIEELIPKSVM